MHQKSLQGGEGEVCADTITGYIYSFDVYAGANSAELLHPKGYLSYTVNFYTSPEPFQELLDSGILATGTVRINRKQFPNSLKPQKKEASRPKGTPTLVYYKNLAAVQ